LTVAEWDAFRDMALGNILVHEPTMDKQQALGDLQELYEIGQLAVDFHLDGGKKMATAYWADTDRRDGSPVGGQALVFRATPALEETPAEGGAG
jgi:hypothetical protein